MAALSLQNISFLFLAALCLLPVISPPMALLLGVVVAVTIGHPYTRQGAVLTKKLLQFSVVGLGFGMNLHVVLKASLSGLGITFVTILATLLIGVLIGKWLRVESKIAHLISVGTAICGGSAIAAVGPVVDADEREMSVSLGTVFVLNSVALLLFPSIGHFFHLSQVQFATWAAIAIHDTSSVVGAAAKYGADALQVATTIKLARALWIVPLTLGMAYLYRRQDVKVSMPVFILLFLLASVAYSTIPMVAIFSPVIVELAKAGLRLTLFLIGAGLSLQAIKAVGFRPFLHGVLLWILVSMVSLWAVLTF